jgi:hypothetical protein
MADEVLVPAKVLQGIMECRDAGEHNMFDAGHTILWCYEHQFPEAAEWVYENRAAYGKGIICGFKVGNADQT